MEFHDVILNVDMEVCFWQMSCEIYSLEKNIFLFIIPENITKLVSWSNEFDRTLTDDLHYLSAAHKYLKVNWKFIE